MNLCQRKITVITLTVLFVFNTQSCFAYSGHLNTLCASGKRYINSCINYARKHPVLSGIAACSIVAGVILGKQIVCKKQKTRVVRHREKLFEAGKISNADKANLTLLLSKAIRDGNEAKVKELLAVGADVNGSYWIDELPTPITPLLDAIAKEKINIVHCLVEYGADVNTVQAFEDVRITALAVAVCQSNLEIVQYLVEHGADINALSINNKKKSTALHIAVACENLDIVCYLIEHGADINAGSINDEFKETTPLQLAISLDELTIVKCLVKHGANVNAFDWCWQSILHRAACHGSLEIVKLLVEAGADLYTVGSYGYFAVDVAENEEIKKYLFSKGAMSKEDLERVEDSCVDEAMKDENRLIVMLNSAIYAEDVERVKSLIALGADVNAVWVHARSKEVPLELAIFFNEAEIVKILVEAGADFNKEDSYGRAVLDCAKNRDIMEYLISKGAKSKYGDVTGMLHDAIQYDEIEKVQVLVELGADINAKCYGISSLDLALSRNKIEIAKYLIEHGADVNAGTSTGWTHLHHVLSNFEMVKMLVEAGADVNKIDKYGSLPLDCTENEEIRNYLISKGAKSSGPIF
jgi:ankyrin repeat protein